MYAVTISDEGACYRCFPPDLGNEAAALAAREAVALGASEPAAPGAGESALSGTASAPATHTFTLDSGASRSFFGDRTTLTPLSRQVAVSLADPTGGPVLAHFSTILPCPAAPSCTLSDLYLPSFSTSLVSGADLQDGEVHQFNPASMASRVLVSGLPHSLHPLPPGPVPTYVPCVEGRQRAAPHSSKFPLTKAPLQTLHMDVWGPARVPRGEVTEVLTAWIPAALLQLRESFGSDFPVLRLHSDRGGEFSSDILRAFRRARGIRQTFTLPDSPQQDGIAERRIGMVMDVARTSMVHAAAPHFLWLFAVRYAAHQINLQPQVSMPETSPALLWTGKVGDASAFRVWGSRAFVRDLSVDKLSPRAVPWVFLRFPPDAPGWQFYHPTSRRVLSSHDVTFDESVPYYRLFPYRTASLPPPASLPYARSPSCTPPPPSVVSQVDALDPVESAGTGPASVASGGAGLGGSSGALSRREPLFPQELREWFARRSRRGVEAGGVVGAGGSAAAEGAGSAGPRGARTGSTGAAGPAGASRTGVDGATGVGATEGARAGPAASSGGPAAARAAGGVDAEGASGAGASEGTGVGGARSGGAAGAGAVPSGAGGAERPRPYFVPLLEQVLGLPPSASPAPALECPPTVPSESQLQPTSPLPAPSPYAWSY
ncbi:unnamed protein product [Closterium sp. NIES-64]|nr:unnamed protein product [Closterium sp. NIES-64]